VFDTGESVGTYDWHCQGDVTLTAGVGYNIMFFAQEHGGGESLNWYYTPPGGSETYINPTTQAGQWRHATGYSIPLTISNTAASSVASSTATLNASLTCPGTSFDVRAYWSTTDHGTNTAAWEASSNASAGTYVDGNPVTPSAAATGLAGSTTYYFTFRASNVGTTIWASNVLSFTTEAGSGGTYYDLAYDGHTNTGGTAPSGGNYLSGTSVTVAAPGTLVKTGHTFDHWNTEANNGGTSYNPTDSISVVANTTLYAQWTINSYSLDYAAGTGGSITGTVSQSVNYGGSGSQVTATPALGYHFVSWSDAYPTAIRTDTNVMASVNATASFALDSYTLTYGAGTHGSIVGDSPQTVSHGGSGTLVTATPATGYHFVSWSDSYPTAARTDSPVTGNLNVSASFAVSSYALTYNGNGSTSGSVPAVAADHEYDSTITVLGNVNSLKKTDHTFAGWNTAADGSGTGYVTGNSFSMPASAVTLYAMWAPNYFLTEVKNNGGAATKELTLTCAVPANAVLVTSGGACTVAFNGVTYSVEASTTLAAGSWTSPVAKFAMSYTYAGLPALPEGGYWKYQTFSAFEGLGGKGFIRRSIVQP
jgi:uncharacterized repeat protein (TIGR02543 family)